MPNMFRPVLLCTCFVGYLHAINITNYWQQIGLPSFTNLPCYEDGVETSSGTIVFHDNYPLTTQTFLSVIEQKQTIPIGISEQKQNDEYRDNNNTITLDDQLSTFPPFLTTVPSTRLSNGRTIRKRYTIWSNWLDVQEQIFQYLHASQSWLLHTSSWLIDYNFGTDRMHDLLTSMFQYIDVLNSGDTESLSSFEYSPVPFVQRIIVPENSKLAIFGDLHGSYHSFLRELYSFIDLGYMDENFIIQSEYQHSFYILFLGDYVDRGYYGLEVLLTILYLKQHNPKNIFISRGNHEDRSLNYGNSVGDFYYEIKSKYDDITDKEINLLYFIYDTLPSAIFLGVKSTSSSGSVNNISYLLCCHGGIEVGYETYPFLSSPIQSTTLVNEVNINYALIHGFFREDWLLTVPTTIQTIIPKKYRNLYTNIGQRPSMEQNKEIDDIDINNHHEICSDNAPDCLSTPTEHPHHHQSHSDLMTTMHDEDTLLSPSLHDNDLLSYPMVTNTGWNNIDWPRNPTDTHPHNGFMWNDFFVYDDNKTLSGKSKTNIFFRPGRGIAYGKYITDYYLNSTGIVGILRAHQHNNARETGPMLDRLKDGTAWNKEHYYPYTDTPFEPLRGMADIWDGASMVLTFLSGSYIPGFDYSYDSYGLLTVPTMDPSTWTIENCGQRVGDPYLIDINKGIQRNISMDANMLRYTYLTSSIPSKEYEQYIKVNHGCNPQVNFICRPTPWKIYARNSRKEKDEETSRDKKKSLKSEL